MAVTRSIPVLIVRAIIRDEAGRVLVLKRDAFDAGGGLWCLPGGKVDYGETLESAVAREVAEETSLVCTDVRFLFYQDSLPVRPGGTHGVNLYFRCEVEGVLRLGADSSEHAWLSLPELGRLKMAFRNDAALERYFDEEACHAGAR
jgi:8-oxo-dGTP diphosphatase